MVERNQMDTAGMRDFDMAVKFHSEFNNLENDIIGKVISNDDFNEWIFKIGIDGFNHGWELDDEDDDNRPWDNPDGVALWNGYRSTVRAYLRNGVMNERYAALENFIPYVVEVNRHGIDLIICEYSDHVIDGSRALAKKRQKTIKNQSRALDKGFDTLINVYNINGMEVQMQKKLMSSHNGVRLSLEVALDEMSKKMEKDLLAILESSQKMTKDLKKITHDAESMGLGKEEIDSAS